MKPTNEEVDKKIAEFMGFEYDPYSEMFRMFIDGRSQLVDADYTKSLDALVPVWEKLRSIFGTEMMFGINIFDYNGKPWNCEFETREFDDKVGCSGICIEHPSISAHESAAHATYKAILELEKTNDK